MHKVAAHLIIRGWYSPKFGHCVKAENLLETESKEGQNKIIEEVIMAKTATISIKMDAALKNEAEHILTSLGLTASQAITVFYKQIAFQNGIPFPVKIPGKKLNDVSIMAMEEEELDEFKSPSKLYQELEIF